MRRTLFASALSLLLLAQGVSANAQSAGGTSPSGARTSGAQGATPVARVNVPLPASDAVLRADLKRLLTEVVPRALAADQARLARVNADVEQFKARTGIDARAFDTVTVGARIERLPSGATKIGNAVAIARGTFSTDALVSAMRVAAKGSLAEQKYAGQTLYVFPINDRIKVFGLARMHVGELAVCVLDRSTLAVGEPAAVRGAIDAAAGRGHVEQSLVNSVQTSSGLVAFAGNVPAGAFAGMETGLPNVDRAVASIRAFYGSLAQTPAGFTLTTVLRAQTSADARQLYDTAQALKQVGPGLISLSGEKGKFAQAALSNLKLSTKGEEVQLQLDVAQGDIAELLRAL
jgi:hypothetical protein